MLLYAPFTGDMLLCASFAAFTKNTEYLTQRVVQDAFADLGSLLERASRRLVWPAPSADLSAGYNGVFRSFLLFPFFWPAWLSVTEASQGRDVGSSSGED